MRKIFKRFAAVVVVNAALIAVAGCGGGDEGTDTSTAMTSTVKTATTATTNTGMESTVSVPGSPAPAPGAEPAPAGGEPAGAGVFEITERQVSPEVVTPSGMMTFSAWVKGDAASVTITVYKRDSGVLAMTLPLAFVGHAGSGIYRWSADAPAPGATGEYRYYASAVATGGATAEMPGVSGWSFCVGNPSVDCL